MVGVAVGVFVGVGVPPPDVVISSVQPPLISPSSIGPKSVPYNRHVPFGFIPLKTFARVPVEAGAARIHVACLGLPHAAGGGFAPDAGKNGTDVPLIVAKTAVGRYD